MSSAIREPAIRELSRAERDRLTTALLAQKDAARSATDRTRAIHDVVLANASVARSIAHRYATRGIDLEDLEQTAYLALVRAATRYDPSRGDDFLAYAIPSVDGEVRHHLRDHGWLVRLPRRLQEVQRRIDSEVDLLHRSGAALLEELARRLALTTAEVDAALHARACLPPASLDAPGNELGADLTAWNGSDHGTAAAEARVILRPLLSRLPERDRRVLRLRYADGLTQQEIADELGVTQAQVSRILSRIHLELHAAIGN